MKSYIPTKNMPPWVRSSGTTRWAPAPTQKHRVYTEISKAGQDGLTRVEIATRIGLAADRISFYLSELRRAGYIAIKGAPVEQNTLSAAESALFAMGTLENALVAKAKETGVTPDLERAFLRYQKVKALALRGLTDGEVRSAVRLALIDLVKMVF